MTSSLLVVDCSAIVELLLDPGDRGAAVAAHLHDRALAAPSLLPFEVTNVLRRQRQAGLLTPAHADRAYADWCDLPVDLWAFATVADRLWRLAGSLSAYDAAYVALAELLQAPLLTCDRKLAGAAPQTCAVVVL